jgi:hypothetical protein
MDPLADLAVSNIDPLSGFAVPNIEPLPDLAVPNIAPSPTFAVSNMDPPPSFVPPKISRAPPNPPAPSTLCAGGAEGESLMSAENTSPNPFILFALFMPFCMSRAGLSSILNSRSGFFGGVTGLERFAALPKAKGPLETSAALLPPML